MTVSPPARAADALRRKLATEPAAFCAELVRIPSPSGDEERAARRCLAEMRALGFDEASVDAAGSVVGLVRSRHPRRRDECLVLCSHLDTVDAGDPSHWSRDPFSGAIEGGRVHGRGASDAKGCVASQVHAGGLLRALRDEGVLELQHDVIVAAVVQEEVGGLGAAALVEGIPRPAAAIIGEPSEGHLAFGHRGRVEAELIFTGRAGHASRPDLAVSPHPSAARLVLALPEAAHDDAPRLGSSSAAVTQVIATPSGANVIPEELRLTIDWRNVPAETPEAVRARLLQLASTGLDAGVTATVETPTLSLRSWSGAQRDIERVSHPFATDPSGAFFRFAHAILESGVGGEVLALAWDFASDGGRLQAAGAEVLGYGPGDMSCMHVRDESVSVELVERCVTGNLLLLCAIDEFLCRGSA